MELIEHEENHRRFKTDDNEYILTRDGGTGFWSVSVSKGAIPKVFDQSYTTLGYALAAVEHYRATRPKKAPKEVKVTTE